MRLVVHELSHGPTGALPPPNVKVPPEQLRKLLVHSIPAGVSQVGGAWLHF